MTQETDLERLRSISQTAAFNRWLGLEVAAADKGRVELRLTWGDEFGQYSSFLHAGIVAGIVDTACDLPPPRSQDVCWLRISP
jgi:acyl-coenzyme A thioesterase PaaI-like protein